MGVPNQRRHENAAFLAGSTGTHSLILHNSRNLRSLTNKRGQKEKKGMITRHQIHVEGKDVETGHLILRNVTQNTVKRHTSTQAGRAYSTEGERVSPPATRPVGGIFESCSCALARARPKPIVNSFTTSSVIVIWTQTTSSVLGVKKREHLFISNRCSSENF